MPDVTHVSPPVSAGLALLVLCVGGYVARVLDGLTAPGLAGRSASRALLEPLASAAVLLRQRPACTERPDLFLWTLAPAAYAACASFALTVVPLHDSRAIADLRTGIVVFGAAEALAIVAIFLHGWSSNAHLALQGGFRFVALGLSYELLSMFVLIAAALPAESLQVSAIVRSQAELWNVLRQPLGLPLWMVVTLGVTFRGPLNLADGTDLAAGTAAEASGKALLLWELARGGMLTVFCAMGAAIWLGGWLGPWAPGWAWVALKTVALMGSVTWLGQRVGRLPAERAMSLLWCFGLPLSFAHLLLAGIEALL